MTGKEPPNRKPRSDHEHVELCGEVRAVDLDDQEFSLRLDDGSQVVAKFTREQEESITQALHEHATCRLRLKGRAELAPSGEVVQGVSIDSLSLDLAKAQQQVPGTKPIWEVIAEISASVPDEEWAKLPADGAKNLDHYLYGAPKKE
jgi:hypothetical protein